MFTLIDKQNLLSHNYRDVLIFWYKTDAVLCPVPTPAVATVKLLVLFKLGQITLDAQLSSADFHLK